MAWWAALIPLATQMASQMMAPKQQQQGPGQMGGDFTMSQMQQAPALPMSQFIPPQPPETRKYKWGDDQEAMRRALAKYVGGG